jgi:hypothetical protein
VSSIIPWNSSIEYRDPNINASYVSFKGYIRSIIKKACRIDFSYRVWITAEPLICSLDSIKNPSGSSYRRQNPAGSYLLDDRISLSSSSSLIIST